MATINFELSKIKGKETRKSQILVRVSISRRFRVGGKTGLFISPKDWNDKMMQVRKLSRIESRDSKKNWKIYGLNWIDLKNTLAIVSLTPRTLTL